MAKVVVIEDDDFVRTLVCRLLQISGHEMLDFVDAKYALRDVNFGEVDLVITDLEMPTRGEVAIETIRERGFEVPIVVMSSHIDPLRVTELMALGAQSILLKPFRIEDFWMITEAWIGRVGNKMVG
ncbi:MAG: response regulator [bacterium]|nr:response regulator [bacterium]